MATTFQKDFVKNSTDYFALLCLQLVGLWGIFWFNYDPAVQFISLLFMGASYVVWGVLHHAKLRDLHLKIFVEYLLFATIALLLVGVLIFKP